MRILPKICWLALMASSFAHAEELGRLFFSPAQRAQMDSNYVQNAQPSDNPKAVMLNGIVQMQGGKRTAWINGVPQAVGRSDDKAPDSMPVPLPGQNKSVKLKVGQRLLLNPSANPESSGQDEPRQ
ncbi:MAG: hypothetical protein WBQ69_09805 [Gallionella sp.]